MTPVSLPPPSREAFGAVLTRAQALGHVRHHWPSEHQENGSGLGWAVVVIALVAVIVGAVIR